MKTFETMPDAGLVSPLILSPDLSVQLCGRRNHWLMNWFVSESRSEIKDRRNCIEKGDTFRTGGVSGCCFMARRDMLADVGFFCEDYFFCPEDIVLSIEAEKKGYGIYVNPAARIVHQHGAASVPIHDVIWPVALHGGFLFIGRQYGRP